MLYFHNIAISTEEYQRDIRKQKIKNVVGRSI